MNYPIKIILILLLIPALNLAQENPVKFQIKKEIPVDSAFFDLGEFALYTKNSDNSQAFKTINHCLLTCNYGHKSRQVVLRTNHLPRKMKKLAYGVRYKKVEFIFTEIRRKPVDALKPEQPCISFKYILHKKLRFGFGCGPWLTIPWPIPTVHLINNEIIWMNGI